MAKLISIAKKDALFAIPYDIELFRLNDEKIRRGETVAGKLPDEEIIRIAVAWDYPELSFASILEMLQQDTTGFSEAMVNDIQSRAVGMINATYVMPFIGRERYIQLAKRHIEKIKADMKMTNMLMAQWWSQRQ
ncbi:MAG TPA: hypothetical protein VJL89_07095 [Thermodesulfovibrionia bacterium]|nr:hypothetical protein [Thermodesulfovibrionia bacterium]